MLFFFPSATLTGARTGEGESSENYSGGRWKGSGGKNLLGLLRAAAPWAAVPMPPYCHTSAHVAHHGECGNETKPLNTRPLMLLIQAGAAAPMPSLCFASAHGVHHGECGSETKTLNTRPIMLLIQPWIEGKKNPA